MHGRKHTRAERRILEENNINTYVWLITKTALNKLYIKHKITGEEKTVDIFYSSIY